jgi:Zn-dependent M28 family amino/carboxypeptidase
MMEVAKVLAECEVYGTIKFIAFGAEELGLHGSRHYTGQMSVEEIDSTIAMINLDCIGGGDFPYVCAGSDGNPVWVRDLALNIADLMGYDLRTSPETSYLEAGTIGDWSDHAPFKYLGIPIACFEWFNWDLGYESEQYGWIMNSCNDTIIHITEEELDQTADVVTALVFELTKTPLPNAEKGTVRARQSIRIQRRPGIPLQ